MQIARLRLAGFKSFVDPAEFRIEAGLTGVVGPNGCGKSNILEALRWVMGAASAKAMRGEGMDDVIFAGAADRPARNHAEVSLLIDNADADAPAPFRAEPVIEVTRRIDRGEGSTFRINGREVRARDVQILFADASTGANSPALVRQGQISELIAAKPQNRRRILEEAAGVGGLHGRRHEAELRVAAAQTNLERLDDLAAELGARLGRLKREARAAARYRALAAEIRALQSGLLVQRWREARGACHRLETEAAAAGEADEAAARAAAVALARALAAADALPALRAADAAAQAALNRLAIDRDRVARAVEQARAEQSRLEADLARITSDDEREGAWLAEAEAALERLEQEALSLRVQAQSERTPALAAAAEDAEARRARAEAEVEALAASLAAAEADARAAAHRLADAEDRLARLNAELDAARRELAEIPAAEGAVDGAAAAAAAAALTAAREHLAECERARGAAHAAETLARMKAREAEDALAEIAAEAAALRRLTEDGGRRAFPPALDQVTPEAGLEAALAAALGDDLDAALDPAAPAHWAGASAEPPQWPHGLEPLAGKVDAPAALGARLAFTALAAAADGARLQSLLPPGARIVSREGDLWRWDGLTVRAGAPRPAQARLEQKARLATLDARLAELRPAKAATEAGHAQARDAVQRAEDALRAARQASVDAETAFAGAQTALDRARHEAVELQARSAALAGRIVHLEREADGLIGEAEAARAACAAAQVDDGLAAALATARAAAASARGDAGDARLAFDAERRAGETRTSRLKALEAERTAWRQRAASAQARREGLAAERAAAEPRLAEAQATPATHEAQRTELLDRLAIAEKARSSAADTLGEAELGRAEADRSARAAESVAADARAARAAALAHLDGARERLGEHAAALAEARGCSTAELDALIGADDGLAGEPGAAERRLAELQREREAAGPVNLLAEAEATELAERCDGLAAERTDLAQALARLRQGVAELNAEGRERLLAAFDLVHGHFRELFTTLFQGGQAELRLVESEDPLEAGLEIFACPPGKRMSVMSLMSGGEQALVAMALIFAVFLHNPAPLCVLDEADAPLDDANVERFCDLLAAMRARASTRFIVISHNALTMSRMDRLYGVTMREPGVSQLVSVDLREAEALASA